MSPHASALAALAAAAAWGFGDFAGGMASRRTSAVGVTVAMELGGLLLLPLVLLVIPTRATPEIVAAACTAGVTGGLGVLLFYKGMTAGLVGVVAPVTALAGTALPVVVGVVGGDRPSGPQVVGIVVGCAAIGLVSGWTSSHVDSGGVLLGLAAGACFGIALIFLRGAAPGGALSFALTRLASAATVTITGLALGVTVRPGRSAWRLIAVCAALDSAAVVMYLIASRGGLLSVTVVLASLYPAFTVFMGKVGAHEKLTRVQAVGAGFALIAVVLIAAT